MTERGRFMDLPFCLGDTPSESFVIKVDIWISNGHRHRHLSPLFSLIYVHCVLIFAFFTNPHHQLSQLFYLISVNRFNFCFFFKSSLAFITDSHSLLLQISTSFSAKQPCTSSRWHFLLPFMFPGSRFHSGGNQP